MKLVTRAPSRNLMFLMAGIFLMATALPGCSRPRSGPVALMPEDQLPEQAQSASAVVKEAYQFAAANPDVMKAIPCYCGCGSIGHTSNYSCYVAGEGPDGGLEFDNHAMGCSICVDITQDAIRLQKQGRSVPEIRAYIDDSYRRYGTSNMDEH